MSDIKQIFVGGLSNTSTEASLKNYFSQFGVVTEVLVMMDRITNRSRGFGFVSFETSSSVDSVISKRDHSVDGKAIEIRRAIPRGSSSQQDQRVNQVYIAGISATVTTQDLKNYFSQFGGEITDAQVLMDKVTGRSRGFGFVTFSSPESVEKIIAMEGHKIGDCTLEVKKAIPKGAAPPSSAAAVVGSASNPNRLKQVFVGGLAMAVTEKELKDYFSAFGTVLEAVVMMDRTTNRSRGFGFVTFDNAKCVDRVLARREHTLHGKPFEIKVAVPKGGDRGPAARPPVPAYGSAAAYYNAYTAAAASGYNGPGSYASYGGSGYSSGGSSGGYGGSAGYGGSPAYAGGGSSGYGGGGYGGSSYLSGGSSYPGSSSSSYPGSSSSSYPGSSSSSYLGGSSYPGGGSSSSSYLSGISSGYPAGGSAAGYPAAPSGYPTGNGSSPGGVYGSSAGYGASDGDAYGASSPPPGPVAGGNGGAAAGGETPATMQQMFNMMMMMMPAMSQYASGGSAAAPAAATAAPAPAAPAPAASAARDYLTARAAPATTAPPPTPTYSAYGSRPAADEGYGGYGGVTSGYGYGASAPPPYGYEAVAAPPTPAFAGGSYLAGAAGTSAYGAPRAPPPAPAAPARGLGGVDRFHPYSR